MKPRHILPLMLALPLIGWCQLSPEQQELVGEHVYGGLPSSDDLLVRTAYIADYDAARKAPKWVAYRLTEDYRITPKRTGRWKSYRADPDHDGEPTEDDYTGLHGDPIRNYARGHLAPFMISGGDRDGDGMVLDADKDGKVEAGDDEDEALTVLEVNYHTNLTPQHHSGFNGSGGVWYDIEKRIREDLLNEDVTEVWVFNGPVFGPGTYDIVGENNDVHVAPMFFQIIIWEPEDGYVDWEAYLMPHHQRAHGDIREQKVSIRHIEAMTGLDFLPDLGLEEEQRISTY